LQVPPVEKHAPGNFCWIELTTTDHSAAKEFYSELLGWTIREFPMGPLDFYTTFKIDGRDAATRCVQSGRRAAFRRTGVFMLRSRTRTLPPTAQGDLAGR